MNYHFITFMVLLPFFGALAQALLSGAGQGKGMISARWIALGASVASSLCAIALVVLMQPGLSELQATEVLPWVGSYAISYDMGIDGLNVLLVLLIAVVFPLLITAEWNQKNSVRGMYGLLLVLQSSLFGVVCAQDLFLLFFFWALSALPFYFLIGIWGGAGRESAAFRSIVAAAIGNALLFAALVLIYYAVDPHTFSIHELSGGKLVQKTFTLLGYDLPVGNVAFGLIGLGLALRAPIWPLHGWFTHAAKEASSTVFVALCIASVLVSIYVFIRLSYSLFPEVVSQAAEGILIVGIVNLLIGGVCAAAQKGLRLLLAFVCMSEVGLILMGISSLNPAGVVGAVYQQLSLGLALCGFGLFSGLVIERTGEAQFLNEKGEAGFGGIAARAPAMALMVGVIVASLLGFPGFGGFVGHALMMIGSYSIHPMALIIAVSAFLLATYYLLMMYRHVFLGATTGGTASFSDLTFRERAYLLPIVGCLLAFGLYPKPLLELVRPTVLTLLSTIK